MASLREAVARVLDEHWVGAGYAAPNAVVYPWQWLWDSCFHVLIWAELGDERALVELASAFSTQDEAGFVPHMNYVLSPTAHAELWGRVGASSITQPPMYGHAVASLFRRGWAVPEAIVDAAARGLRFLLKSRPRTLGGLVPLCHPWESGCDDSPRWDDLCPGDGFDLTRWRAHKGELVASVERNAVGSPIANPAFAVASAGFNALVAFNAAELASVTGDTDLADQAVALAEAIAARWDPRRCTWADEGDTEHGSGRARTADGLLPLLVCAQPDRVGAVAAALLDPAAYGSPFGPCGVHRAEPSFAPTTYWRGPCWPQLNYLLWLALRRSDVASAGAAATALAAGTVAGAQTSGLAEYWHPDTGAGLGAIPQSWTGLALLMT